MSKITATLAVTAALLASNLALADGLTRQQVKAELAQAWIDGTVSVASLGQNGSERALYSFKKADEAKVQIPGAGGSATSVAKPALTQR